MLCISSVQNNPDLPPGILQTRGFPGVTVTRIQFDVRGWTLLPLINVLFCLTRWKWQQWPANESQRVPISLAPKASISLMALREDGRTGLAELRCVTPSTPRCLPWQSCSGTQRGHSWSLAATRGPLIAIGLLGRCHQSSTNQWWKVQQGDRLCLSSSTWGKGCAQTPSHRGTMRPVLVLKCCSLHFVALGNRFILKEGTDSLRLSERHKTSFPTSKAFALATPYHDDYADLISTQRANMS